MQGKKPKLKRYGKITPNMERDIKAALALPPFKLSPMVEPSKPRNKKYYPSYNWTQKRLKHYILDQWGIELHTSTCSKKLREWSPPQEMLIDEFTQVGLSNMWLLMNAKICEKVKADGVTTSYYFCIAYSWGCDDVYFNVYTTRSKYAEFIDHIFTEYINNESIIFFAESKSNKKVKDDKIKTFAKHQDKIMRIVRATMHMDYFLDEIITPEDITENDGVSSLIRNIYECFEQSLPYFVEGLECLPGYEDAAAQLEDAFADFSLDLQIGLNEIRSVVDKLECWHSAHDVRDEIEYSFKRISFRET